MRPELGGKPVRGVGTDITLISYSVAVENGFILALVVPAEYVRSSESSGVIYSPSSTSKRANSRAPPDSFSIV